MDLNDDSDDSEAAPGDGELGEELQGVELQQEVRGVEAGHQLTQQTRPLHSLGAHSCVKSMILKLQVTLASSLSNGSLKYLYL